MRSVYWAACAAECGKIRPSYSRAQKKYRGVPSFFPGSSDRSARGCYNPGMAVYTHLSNEQIAELLTQYGIGSLDYALGIAQGVENSNYLIGTHGSDTVEQKYILTLYEKRVKEEELPFFLGLMQHLASRGITCPQPIARSDGGYISQVAGKKAAIVSFISGKSRSVLRPEHCGGVGGMCAKLHLAAADFAGARANALSLAGWKSLVAKIAPRLDEVQHGLQQLVQHELEFLEANWPTELPAGVVHADLFPDNVFFLDDTVSGVIDFYFACTDAFAYDLAITLNSWCFDGRECNLTKAKQMVTQYQKVRALSDAEKKAFPILLRGAALRFLLTRAHDLLHHEKSALVTPKDPLEYVAKLKFHQMNTMALVA